MKRARACALGSSQCLPCHKLHHLPRLRPAARRKHGEKMAEAGLPTPANAVIRKPGDLAGAAKSVGFPAVLKPTSGAASLGVIRVDNEPDLHRCGWGLLCEPPWELCSCLRPQTHAT